MEYGTIGEDGCCCGHFENDIISVRTHCWRSTHDCDCEYSGVHYTQKGNPIEARAKAEEIAAYISKAWLTDVKIVRTEVT